MANKKISQLASSATLTGTEELPLVQGGVTLKTTAQDIADLAGGLFEEGTGGAASTQRVGSSNTASGTESTVGGGTSNTASGYRSVVSGGGNNTASG